MSQIKIHINNRSYTVACDDGQEEHLHKLADFLDGRVRELSDSLGQIGDTNLLVMAGLLVADEMADSYAEIDNLKQELARKDTLLRQANIARSEQAETGHLQEIARRIEALSDRLEGI